MGFNKDDPEPVTVPKACVKRHNNVIQLFKHRLEKPFPGLNRFCLHYPDFTALRTCDSNTTFKHSFKHTSWSVLKRICTIFKVPTVSCCSGQLIAGEENVGKRKKIKMLEEEVEEFIASETGRDRLIRAWNDRPNEGIEPAEFKFMSSVTKNIMLVLFLWRFFESALNEGEAFKIRNRTTLYGTKSLAQRRYAMAMILKGLKSGGVLSLKGGAFTLTFMSIWRGLCVYYNTTSPWTFTVATAAMISLFKTWLGPRAMFGGAIIGSVFGAVGGMAISLACHTIGHTQEEVNYYQVEQIVLEKRAFREFADSLIDDEDEKVD